MSQLAPHRDHLGANVGPGRPMDDPAMNCARTLVTKQGNHAVNDSEDLNIGSYGVTFYDLGLVSAFDNKDDFWAYTKYPEHDEVLEFIQSVQLDEQIVDYELD